MTRDRFSFLDELPLPLYAGAGSLEAIEIAVAVEDALDITLPDDVIDVVHLGRRDSIETTVNAIDPPV